MSGEAMSPRVWVAGLKRSAPSSSEMVGWPRSARSRSNALDQRAFVGVQPLQIAELGLAVGAPARADDQRRFLVSHGPAPAPRRRSNRGSAESRSPPARAG